MRKHNYAWKSRRKINVWRSFQEVYWDNAKNTWECVCHGFIEWDWEFCLCWEQSNMFLKTCL